MNTNIEAKAFLLYPEENLYGLIQLNILKKSKETAPNKKGEAAIKPFVIAF
jgi:hypothetical protein